MYKLQRCFLLALLGLTVFALPAIADWNLGDPFKMHWPQLPDPNGWDVNFTFPFPNRPLADDWRCTESGPVSDIHFWYSWNSNQVGQVTKIHASIHDDVPVGPQNPLFSHPGNLLWERDFLPTQFAIRWAGDSPQGWIDPGYTPPPFPNHNLYFQANITNIPQPFVQEKDKIYWLDLSVETVNGVAGWKTTLDALHFNDNAVFWNAQGGTGAGAWEPLIYPTGHSLDMAFVITPEPGTVVMLVGAGLVGLGLVVRRRWRK